MEFDSDKMVLSHASWKTRLKNALQKKETIDIVTSERDDRCELGKWLNSDGRRYEQLHALQDLKAKHTRFHAAVGEVLRRARSCEPSEALGLIDPMKSEFGRASTDCIIAIGTLRQAIAKG